MGDLILRQENIARTVAVKKGRDIVCAHCSVCARLDDNAVLPIGVDLDDGVARSDGTRTDTRGIYPSFRTDRHERLQFRRADAAGERRFRTAAAECDRLVETLPAPGGTVFSAGDCFTWTDDVLKLIDPIYVDRADNESSFHNVLPFLHARALSLLISLGSKYMD